MQIEFNYWYERWMLNWLESLSWMYFNLEQPVDHDAWWSYGAV